MNRIECNKMIKLIHKKADGKLTEMENILLKKHLGKCQLCRYKIDGLEKIGFFIKNSKILPPVDFTNKVLSRISEDKASVEPIKKSFLFTVQLKWVSAMGVIIILLSGAIFFATKSPLSMGVNFTIKIPEAQMVSLVGDFNNWDVNASKLVRQDGKWTIKLNLPQGRYQYVFVVDGEKWITDPTAREYIDNGYGSKNSVLDITPL